MFTEIYQQHFSPSTKFIKWKLNYRTNKFENCMFLPPSLFGSFPYWDSLLMFPADVSNVDNNIQRQGYAEPSESWTCQMNKLDCLGRWEELQAIYIFHEIKIISLIRLLKLKKTKCRHFYIFDHLYRDMAILLNTNNKFN